MILSILDFQLVNLKSLISKTKLKIFVFSFLLSSANLIYSDNLGNCDFKSSQYTSELQDLDQVKSINIKVNNYRKWSKNILNAFVSRESSILPKFKKRFKAEVITTYSFGECKHKAKIRLHGDWKDHINFEQGGQLNQSIDVMLEEGSIANIVKFKLLLPKTRRYENEIIITKVLRLSNFLSPRTSLMNVKINETKSRMLFQEKASKELLESMNRREGPLFEGDERFLFNNFNIQSADTSHLDLENISLSKITNDNWASRNHVNAKISINSFAALQKAYMNYGQKYLDDYILDWDILSRGNQRLIDNWAMFEMLLFATNSFHALRPHNRKFYYNSFDSGFEPIYFDGDPRDIDSKWLRLMPDFSKYPNLKSIHFKDLYEILDSIHPEVLANEMGGNQFVLSENQAKKIIENTLNKISRIHKKFEQYKQESFDNLTTNSEVQSLTENLIKDINISIPNSHIVDINGFKNYEETDSFGSKICTLNMVNCFEYNITISEVGKLLEKKYLQNLELKTTLFILPSDQNISQPLEYNFLDDSIKVRASKSTLVRFDTNNSELKFVLNDSNSWALITQSNLSNIKIIVRSNIELANPVLPNVRINEFGLTGCLTIHRSLFKQTKISANATNSNCEDVLNIINGEGKIETIKISNSNADALDIDFSNLNVEEIYVSNAKNDCIDFSKGNYFIENVNVNSCGDKGVSIGEDSIFNSSKIKINEANIGVSSKDSSEANIKLLEITNVDICAEAFQKKQEFFGAKLNIRSLVCNSDVLRQDKNSIIKTL